jgi:hypothetical protein
MTYGYPTPEMQQYASMMAMQQQQASTAFQQAPPGGMRQYPPTQTRSCFTIHGVRRYYPPQYYVQGGPVSAVSAPLFCSLVGIVFVAACYRAYCFGYVAVYRAACSACNFPRASTGCAWI